MVDMSNIDFSELIISKKRSIFFIIQKVFGRMWVDGKLFDIKSSHSVNGVTSFTGLYDYAETALKKQLKENLDRNDQNDNQLISQLITSLQQLFFEENATATGVFNLTRSAFLFTTERLPFPYCDISTPPPQACWRFPF